MELEVLEGAARTIQQFRPRLFLENDRAAQSPALIEHLLALDYRLYWFTPPLYRADNFFGDEQNIFGRLASIDMLCVPRAGRLAITVTGCAEITSGDSKPPVPWNL